MWSCIVGLLLLPSALGSSPLRLRGGSGGLSLDTLLETAKSPEAAEELRQLMEDPEAMKEARAMMDDPEFRAQMMAALGSGGSKLAELQATLSDDSMGLTDSLQRLGPSLGASLDILKETCESADELGVACDTLDGLIRRLARTADADHDKYRRVRLSNAALQSRLLRHAGGRRCLEAIGFSREAAVDGEEYLEHTGEGLPETSDGSDQPTGALARQLSLVQEAREAATTATSLSEQHGLPYRIALALPAMRRACEGDAPLGQMLTQMLLHNDEFSAHAKGPAAELALPSLLQIMRSKQGIEGLVEYYTGAPLVDSRVLRVSSVSEWKQALHEAADRPVCALFANSADVGCRVLSPIFARLPDAEDGAFGGVDFLHIVVDASRDDGLCGQVFEEAFIAGAAVPTFAFYVECAELRKWRYTGCEVSEVVRRLKRIAADDNLDDGPDGDDGE